MKQGNIQNFAIIVLVNGSTKQVYLTKEQNSFLQSSRSGLYLKA